MKTIIAASLLIQVSHPGAFAATRCDVNEYPDRIAVTCIGEERENPDSRVATQGVQRKPVERYAQSREPVPRPLKAAPATGENKPPPVPSGQGSHQADAAGKGPDSSDRLEKRRSRALHNTRNLMNVMSGARRPDR